MKAVQFSEFGGPEVLKVADVPIHTPGPGRSASRFGPPG